MAHTSLTVRAETRVAVLAASLLGLLVGACPRATISANIPCETQHDCESWQHCADNICTPASLAEDAGMADAMGLDAAANDAAVVDHLSPDALHHDASASDLQPPDTARPDTAQPDTFRPDTFRPDTAQPDTWQAPSLAFEYIEVINISENQVTVHAGYNMHAQSQIEYGTSTAYGQWGPQEQSFNFAEMFHVLNGLAPATLYHYRVHGWDPQGHELVSDDHSFTTQAAAQLSMCDNYPATNGLIAPGNPIRNYSYHDKDGSVHHLCELAATGKKLLYIVLSGFT